MTYSAWLSGYKVEVADWYDRKHYIINVAYYAPGSSLSRAPQKERAVLIPIDNYWDHAKPVLSSLTEAIARMPAHEPGNLPVIQVTCEGLC